MICSENGFIKHLSDLSGIDQDCLIECIMTILSIRHFDYKEENGGITITADGNGLYSIFDLYVNINQDLLSPACTTLPPFSVSQIVSLFNTESISIYDFMSRSEDFISASYSLAKDIDKWNRK